MQARAVDPAVVAAFDRFPVRHTWGVSGRRCSGLPARAADAIGRAVAGGLGHGPAARAAAAARLLH
eukprot:11209201-Lingulodinium_polyedra.AAC.1